MIIFDLFLTLLSKIKQKTKTNKMTFSRLKFQQIVSILLLCGYIVGNFSLPIVEGIHFVLHLGDDAPLHAFQTHQTNHSHQLLASLEEAVTDSSTDIPLKNNSTKDFKKVVQQLITSPFLLFNVVQPTTIENFFQLNIYQSPNLQIIAPPPQV